MRRASALRWVTIVIATLAALTLLVSLGLWQLQRLEWKRDLIERVEQRVHALPLAPPARARWPQIDAANSEYLHVVVQGRYRHERETHVQAVTERGGGFWVLTPFDTVGGYTVLVNRGFVLPENRDPATRLQGQIEGVTTVTGLVRMSEPHGAYLRSNAPAADRWYSRDVAAIAATRGLGEVAPYFIDADASAMHGGDAPAGGLTVVTFANNHLQYALTWFGLSLMVAGGAVLVFRQEWRWYQQLLTG